MKLTARNLIIVGFIISFAALLLNAIFLAEVNGRLKNAESESSRVSEELREQTALGNEGQKKFEDYRMMTHLAEIVPASQQADTLDDAASLLQEALLFVYASGNDLSITEFRRAEAEADAQDAELEERYEAAKNNPNEKAKQPEEKHPTEEKSAAQDEENFDHALKVLKERENESGEVDYKAKLGAIGFVSGKIIESKGEGEFFVRLYPIYKLLNERFLENVDKKQARAAELSDERRHLADLQSYGTFGALALQMFGLAFVFLKDILGQKGK